MILAGRLYVAGPATFYWRALGYGWTWTVVIAWASWMAQRRSVATPDPSRHAVDAPALFTMLSVQVLLFNVALSGLYVPLHRSGFDLHRSSGASIWLPVAVQFAWIALAQARVAWLGASAADLRAKLTLAMLLVAMLAVGMFVIPFGYWQADRPAQAVAKAGKAAPAASDAPGDDEDADAGPETPMLKLSQDVFESQQRLLGAQLDAIARERPGVVDMYAITFAPTPTSTSSCARAPSSRASRFQRASRAAGSSRWPTRTRW